MGKGRRDQLSKSPRPSQPDDEDRRRRAPWRDLIGGVVIGPIGPPKR